MLAIGGAVDVHLGDKPRSNLMLDIPCLATQPPPLPTAHTGVPGRQAAQKAHRGWVMSVLHPGVKRLLRRLAGLAQGVVPLLAAMGIHTLGQAREAAQKTFYARVQY